MVESEPELPELTAEQQETEQKHPIESPVEPQAEVVAQPEPNIPAIEEQAAVPNKTTAPAEMDFDAEFGIPLDAPSGYSEDADPQDEVELGVLTIRDNPKVRNTEANEPAANTDPSKDAPQTTDAEEKAAAPAPVSTQPDELTVENWWQWVDVLPLQGFTQSIASNLVLTKVEAGQYHFDLHPDQSFLFNESQQYEIEQALRSFVADASVIITKQVPTMESPAERDQRLAADARILAQQALETDTLIQRIVQEFDAQIIDSTIRPVS